jgi:nicotinate-nucleotide pyrophosphorylase (carboxylating)
MALDQLTPPDESGWSTLIDLAIAEDLGPGDLTSELTIPAAARCQARIEARAPIVVCGLFIAQEVFRRISPEVEFTARAGEGEAAAPGRRLADLEGPARAILAAERTALNFMGRLSGIATLTRRYVDAVSGTTTDIVDTRKTTPGWRVLEKFAVLCGGGVNHRQALFDGILLKDNHIAAAGGVTAAVRAALDGAPAAVRVQVEVESLEQALEACEAGADFLLLDNCTSSQIIEMREALAGRAVLEASGGITLENVRAYAKTGVDRISIGALTHSAPCADVALEIDAVLPGLEAGAPSTSGARA